MISGFKSTHSKWNGPKNKREQNQIDVIDDKKPKGTYLPSSLCIGKKSAQFSEKKKVSDKFV